DVCCVFWRRADRPAGRIGRTAMTREPQAAIKIKICGVIRFEDAAMVAAAGVDFVGLNFWPSSKRYLPVERAPAVAEAARGSGRVAVVGVFVNTRLDDIVAITRTLALDVAQLHGDE